MGNLNLFVPEKGLGALFPVGNGNQLTTICLSDSCRLTQVGRSQTDGSSFGWRLKGETKRQATFLLGTTSHFEEQPSSFASNTMRRWSGWRAI